MRTLPTAAFLAATALAASAGPAGAATPTAAAAAATTQIYQQRTADGRILLTDRPSPTATTERSWQMAAEDAAAARQRALDVRLEAQAVTERVQRSMERQRPGPAVEMRAAPQRGAMGFGDAYDDEVAYGGGGVISPYYPGLGLRGRAAGTGSGGFGSYGGGYGYAEGTLGRPIGLGDSVRLNNYAGSRPRSAHRGSAVRGPAGPGSR